MKDLKRIVEKGPRYKEAFFEHAAIYAKDRMKYNEILLERKKLIRTKRILMKLDSQEVEVGVIDKKLGNLENELIQIIGGLTTEMASILIYSSGDMRIEQISNKLNKEVRKTALKDILIEKARSRNNKFYPC